MSALMLPYVTEGKGAEQCIAEGMDCDVPVGMGNAAHRAFYPDSSEHERKSCRKSMYIVAVSYPESFHILFRFGKLF